MDVGNIEESGSAVAVVLALDDEEEQVVVDDEADYEGSVDEEENDESHGEDEEESVEDQLAGEEHAVMEDEDDVFAAHWLGADVDDDDEDGGEEYAEFEVDDSSDEDDGERILFQYWHQNMGNRNVRCPGFKDASCCEKEYVTIQDLMTGYKLIKHMCTFPHLMSRRFPPVIHEYLMKRSWRRLLDELRKLEELLIGEYGAQYYYNFLVPFGIQLLKAAVDFRCKTVIRCLLTSEMDKAYALPPKFQTLLLQGNILMPVDYPGSHLSEKYRYSDCLTALEYAYTIGHMDIVNVLLELGAKWTDKKSRYFEKNPEKPLSLFYDVSAMFLSVVYGDVKMLDFLLKRGVKPANCCARKTLRDTEYSLAESEVPLWAVAMEMKDLRPLISLLSADVCPQTPSYPLSRQRVTCDIELYNIDAYAMNVTCSNFRIASILYMAGLDAVVARYYHLKVQYEDELFLDEDMTIAQVMDMTKFISLINNARSLEILARNAIRDAIHKRGGHVPTDVEHLDLGQPQVDLLMCRDLLELVR